GTNPPRFVLFSNFPQLIKESYKRFIENQIRENFGFEGVPISLIFKKK
ncbi:ribosome biogenesis GTPase Der, partial [bacterium]|nr:ribosome biogenesis GTPase Der [bacterium]